MRQHAEKRAAPKTPPETLKGWQQIAAFLGEPTSVVQRWASDGMPVRRQGRYVETTPDELNAWLGKESGKPVHVAPSRIGKNLPKRNKRLQNPITQPRFGGKREWSSRTSIALKPA
jgi:hypothetical protein